MLTREHSSYTEPDLFSLSTPKMLWLVGFTSGLSALCDVVITVGLSYYLNSKRTGFKRYVLWVSEVRDVIFYAPAQNGFDYQSTDHICRKPWGSYCVSLEHRI